MRKSHTDFLIRVLRNHGVTAWAEGDGHIGVVERWVDARSGRVGARIVRLLPDTSEVRAWLGY